MTYGPEIPVNGVRPAWLGDDDLTIHKRADNGYEQSILVSAVMWGNTAAIRLPADHPASRALNAGFEPWSGGDAAPADWDGGEVLLRNGSLVIPYGAGVPRLSALWQRDDDGDDIIGYRKRTAATPPADTVTIARMSEAEAREMLTYDADTIIQTMRDWGYLRPETRPERFTRETGIPATPEIVRALEWAETQWRVE
jgi:hypothetical protein